MIVLTEHPDISRNQETRLAVAAAASATALTVLANPGFTADDYVVVGHPGEELTEIRKIASVSGSTGVVVDALKNAHAVDTPITFIPYNQIKVYKSATKTGTYSVLATVDIAIDQDNTPYNHSAGLSSDYYKTVHYNATNGLLTAQSGPISAAGPEFHTLQSMLERVLAIFPDVNSHYLYQPEVTVWINEAYERLYRTVLQGDQEFEIQELLAQTLVADTQEYSLPTDCVKVERLDISFDGINYDTAQYESWGGADKMGGADEIQSRSGTAYSTTNPFYYLKSNKFGVRPTPTAAGKYNLYYTTLFTPLVAMDDEIVRPLKAYSSIIVNFTKSRAHEKRGDRERAIDAKAEAEQGESDMMVEVEQQNDRPGALDMAIDVNAL